MLAFDESGSQAMRITPLDKRFAMLLVLAGTVSSAGCAEGPPPRGGPPGGPPQAALDACASRMARASCYFEDGPHQIRGRCDERGGHWVCVPDREGPAGAPEGGRGTAGTFGAQVGGIDTERRSGQTDGQQPAPPPGAIEACASRRQGAACSVQTPRGELDGRCALEGDVLACIPSDPSHRPVNGPSPEEGQGAP